MKAVQFALAAVLASGAVLSTQELTPRYEVGLNYSWLHVNSANEDRQRTGSGGSGSLAYNINNVVGLVADFGGYANTRINDPVAHLHVRPAVQLAPLAPDALRSVPFRGCVRLERSRYLLGRSRSRLSTS